jgi:hypothetical protein
MSHVASVSVSPQSNAFERSQNTLCGQAEGRGVQFSSFVEVRGVPFEDRAGFVPARQSAPPPVRPAQTGIHGDGLEMMAEMFLGFCSRVAERRREAALRRAEQQEEREKLKGLGGKVKEIERPGIFRAASQLIDAQAQDLRSVLRSDVEEIFSSITGRRSDPNIGQACGGSQCK